MDKRNYYISLLMLLNDAAEELGIADLKEGDKELLAHIWRISDQGREDYSADYAQFAESYSKASRTGFLRSIRKLQKHGLLNRVGRVRDHNYRLNTT